MFAKYVTNTYETIDTYKSVVINANDAKVKIEPSDDTGTIINLIEKKRNPYEYIIRDGILTIKPKKTKWFNLLKIGIDHSEITLRIPSEALDTLTVDSTVGAVDIRSIKCKGAITVEINTGRVTLENVSCKTLNSKGNTGYISLCNLVAEDDISIKRNTGKVILNDVSSPEILVKTNTGSVSGRLPSNTVFTVRTNIGKIEVPTPPIGEVIGGKCEIKTNTGSVRFENHEATSESDGK